MITAIFLSFINSAKTQQLNINDKPRLGIQISQYQRDFGIGLNLASPPFARQRIAIRVRSHVMFDEHLQDEETTWATYLNTNLGVAGKTGSIGESIRLYGEGGVIGLFLSDEFSSESFEFGGYGLFGFEFYMGPLHYYFIEIGATGTGAKADEVLNHPIYSNGLTISTGFRLFLYQRTYYSCA